METLLTGKIDILSQSFLTHLSMKSSLIISSENESLQFSGKNITLYYQSILDDDFLNLYSSYTFDAVIFFLSTPESTGPDRYEIDKLERVLEACVQSPVKKVIVISSAYVYKNVDTRSENVSQIPSDNANIRLFSLEELCRTYRETYDIPITVLRTSCLYGEEEIVSYVGKNVKNLVEKEETILDGKPDQVVEFLSLTDLGRLIERILLEPQKNISLMDVPGASSLSLRQFASLLKQKKGAVTIRFSEKELAVGPPLVAYLASKEYYWEPTIELHEQIEAIIETVEEKHQVKTKTLWERTREFYQSHSSILAVLELFVGFFLMEYLVGVSQTSVQFRVVDFRMIFVVLFAIAHGPQIGLAAALMASLSIYLDYEALGTGWRILLYNVENWIPFASYFIVAWIVGYIRDRYRRDLADTNEEVDALSNRYALLNDLYVRSLERKSLYEKQIISYNDSFGKLYQFTSQLEYAEPAFYLIKALNAVEEMLDNQTVSIYLSKKSYSNAYRYVCSTRAEDITPERFDLNKYPELKKVLTNGGVWTNKKQLKGYPDYAVRIYTANKFAVLITVHAASFDQMSLYFENLIQFTGHFVSTSLEHKMETHGELLTKLLTDFLEEASEVKRSTRSSNEIEVKSSKERSFQVVDLKRNTDNG